MKILLAEDSSVIRMLLERILTVWGYEVVLAEDGEAAWRVLAADDPPSIALLDWMMPGLDGLEVCKRVREARREPYVYIILLTGKEDQADVTRGLAAGADDYLKKPFDNADLEARIRTGRRMVEQQAEVVAARVALREQATTDPLTGLANRRTILERLEKERERSRRMESPCAVVLVEIDSLQRADDVRGRAAGDAVLRHAAATMQAILRPYDLLGRYGDDELIVVLPECDARGARAAAERLRAALSSASVTVGGKTLPVTCSLGVVVGGAGSELDRDGLLAAAKGALDRAKSAGGDREVRAGEAAQTDGPARPAEDRAGKTASAPRRGSRKR